jgi:hypothetical protein
VREEPEEVEEEVKMTFETKQNAMTRNKNYKNKKGTTTLVVVVVVVGIKRTTGLLAGTGTAALVVMTVRSFDMRWGRPSVRRNQVDGTISP